ncbi:MAG: N-acetylmuramic acid 6-phosphate etherase [Planctomycetes bacterium]|nr:N-acetylmuramic acid 6-phosphate etherase [Planctomycetota bacterium]
MSASLEFLKEILAGDRSILDEVGKALPQIAQAAEAIAERLRKGGRLFYAGAGTSGRLGILDAAEIPPTFGTKPELVTALIAGGDRAIRRSVEGAEDEADGGAEDLERAGMQAGDALVAVAASGTTPYVLGAVRSATERGALGVALVCSPGTPLAEIADIAIVIRAGPEVVSGSTRMKAATGQKIVLTMLSTTVMKLLGRIYQGEMVAMDPTNHKLRARAARIACDLLGIEPVEARNLLESSEWNLPISLVRGRFGLTVEEAQERLERHGGSVAAALEEQEPDLELP